MPEVRFPILVGVSSGAINVAHLASCCDDFGKAVEELTRLWTGLTPDRVMRTAPPPLFLNVFLWGLRLVSGGSRLAPTVRGLVDCAPLSGLLVELLGERGSAIRGIQDALESGRLESVAVSASCYDTGEHLTWVQGCEVPASWKLSVVRACAPSSPWTSHGFGRLPLLFPAVRVEGLWYGDGGIGMAPPLSPAIHLGADRMLVLMDFTLHWWHVALHRCRGSGVCHRVHHSICCRRPLSGSSRPRRRAHGPPRP